MIQAESQPLYGPARAFLTTGILLATMMQVIDTTIANVALPHMMASLGATQDTISWVLTSYVLASAVVLPLSGWLSTRIGARRMFLGAVIGFVLASALCGMAQTLPQMVAFRVAQGICGSFLIPLGQTFLLDAYPRDKMGQAMGIWSAGVMVGPVLGPVLGGWLTDNYNWRWVFYVNVPIGVIGVVILMLALPRKVEQARPLDGLGYALMAAAILSLQLMLDRGERQDWFNATEIWVYLGLCVSATWALVLHFRYAEHPLFSREVLSDRNFVVGGVFMLVLGVVAFGALALIPQMLQTFYGHPTLHAGLLMMPRGIGMMVTMMFGGRLLKYMDTRLLMTIGMAGVILSLYQMVQFAPVMDSRPVVISGLVQGAAMGLLFVPTNLMVMSTVPAQFRTEASSLYNLCRSMGVSLGVSITATMLARNMQVSHADIAGNLDMSNLPVGSTDVVGMFGSVGDSAVAMVNAEVTRQALFVSFIDDFYLMLILMVLSLPLVLLVKPAKPQSGPPMDAGH